METLELIAYSFLSLSIPILLTFLLKGKEFGNYPRNKNNYYVMGYSFGGWKVYDGLSAFRLKYTSRYYLRKIPFTIEVTAEGITAADGNCYNAISSATLHLPHEMAPIVAKKYFLNRTVYHFCDEQIDAEIMPFLEVALENAVRNYNGTESPDELTSHFKAEAMVDILSTHHTLISVSRVTLIKN